MKNGGLKGSHKNKIGLCNEKKTLIQDTNRHTRLWKYWKPLKGNKGKIIEAEECMPTSGMNCQQGEKRCN